MSIKLTEARLESLVETLNALICEEGLLNREQRENMVRTVATIGGLEERLRLSVSMKDAEKQARADKPKKPREPDLVFPRTGRIWTPEENEVINMVDGLPDDELDNHILWMSDQLGRTPYAIASKIVAKGRRDDDWAKTWKDAAKEIRKKHAQQLAAADCSVPDTTPEETCQ